MSARAAKLELSKAPASWGLRVARRPYNARARLPNAERKRTRPAFFGSICGTLDHLVAGSRIWLARFSGGEVLSTLVWLDF